MRKLAVNIGITFLLLPLSLMASSINPYNNRPVDPKAPPPNERSAQQMLDITYGHGVMNADSSQQGAGEWQDASQFGLTMVGENAGYANSNVFGIWSGSDPASLTMLDIFEGPASAGCTASVSFAGGNVTISDTSGGSCGSGAVNTGTFAGINPNGFGFFLRGPGTTNGLDGAFFTADSLNGGDPQALDYRGGGDEWAILFEDLPTNGISDWDFNDQVVRVDSLVAVPEASTLSLLGLGLLGILGIGMRRKFAATA